MSHVSPVKGIKNRCREVRGQQKRISRIQRFQLTEKYIFVQVYCKYLMGFWLYMVTTSCDYERTDKVKFFRAI